MSKPNEIYNTCISLVENAIGDRLHQLPSYDNNTVPAIYKVRASGQAERLTSVLPFCVITSQGRRRHGFGPMDSWYDTEGNEVLRSIYDALVTFSVYGGDAEDMAGVIEEYLFTEQAITTMCDGGLVLVDTFGVDPETTVLDGVAQDFASVQVKFSTNSRVYQSVDSLSTFNADLRLRYPESDVDLITTTLTNE